MPMCDRSRVPKFQMPEPWGLKAYSTTEEVLDQVGAVGLLIWSDYQLRCKFPTAMTVAPEMFDVQHWIGALKLVDKVLRAPLGMKTLDPSGLQYRPVYHNSNDSTDAAIAKGLNYLGITTKSWKVMVNWEPEIYNKTCG
ncbi:amylo-alpha-1,6-glucosidase-domain-containing protein [Mycena leptocephala]|nr:amylo-alpha-1,6-glucosidase-domain-containing protein [Mycena leptocephala]